GNTDEIRDSLAQINKQALRAGEVIRRLRTFVSNREVRRERVDCNRLLEDLATLARPDSNANGVRLVFDVEEQLPPLMADPVQLQQVLINLLRNAIDATVQDAATRPEIILRAARVAEGVEFSVRDYGPGVEPRAIDSLFNPFFTTKANGTGLGLAISRTIVLAHGGKLAYRPAPDGGACFHFTLPTLQGMSQ